MRPNIVRAGRLIGFLAVTLAQGLSAQTDWPLQIEDDPADAPFVTEDVEHFIAALARLETEVDTLRVLEEEYLAKGSPGLRAYVARYDLTAERLRAAIREQHAAYVALPTTLSVLKEEVPRYRQALADLKQHIPQALFSPTYFLVGAHRGYGAASEAGTLVTIETRSPTSLRGHFVTLIVHEMVHMQQAMATGPETYQAIYGPERSLLALTIREGIAEFFTELSTGSMTQDKAHGFVLEHERTLWDRFTPMMLAAETGDWMWVAPEDPEQPPHVAYAMGALIARAYYENADNKQQAVREILSVTDYPAFLERSGYAPQ